MIERCPKCGSNQLEAVHVLDADNNDLGESLYCKKCHWLEGDEWPNVIAAE